MSDMSNEQMMSVLYGLTEEQLKQNQELITQLQSQNEALNKTNKELLLAVKTLKAEAEASVKNMINAEVQGIAKATKEDLKNAVTEALGEAKEVSQSVNKSLGLFGFRWFLIWGAAIILAMGIYAIQHKIYDVKVSSLLQYQFKLEDSIDNLKLLNKGEVIVNNCDDQPCVKIDEKKRFTTKKGDVLYVIKE